MYVCVGGGDYILTVFMYTEKKFHKFTETALPLPLTSDERLLSFKSREQDFQECFQLSIQSPEVFLINSTDVVRM